MPLQEQNIRVDFTGGLDNKTDERLVVPTKLTALTNATFNKTGTLEPRDGWNALTNSGSTSFASQYEMMSYFNQLLYVDDANVLATYGPNTAAGTYSVGQVPYCSLRKDIVRRATGYQAYIDSAYANGVSIYVWQDSQSSGTPTGINCAVIDEATGAIVTNNLQIVADTAALSPRVCAIGSTFLIAYQTGANINVVTMAVGGVATTGSTTVANDLNIASAYFEFVKFSASKACLIWVSDNTSAAGVNSVRAALVDVSRTVTDGPIQVVAQATEGRADINTIAAQVFSTNTSMGVAIGTQTNGVYTAILALSSFAVAAGPTQLNAGTLVRSLTMCQLGTSLQIFGGPGLGNPAANSWTRSLSITNTAGTQTTVVYSATTIGPILGGKAFSVGSIAYAPFVFTTVLQAQQLVLDTSGNLISRALYGNYGSFSSNFLQSSPTLSTGVINLPVSEFGRAAFDSSINVTQQGISRVKLTFGRSNTTYPLFNSESANTLFLSGGYVGAFDGARVTEAGFNWYPEGITAVDSGVAGLPNGTYQYVAVYEWIDTFGQRHQSVPSPASPSPYAVSLTVSSKKVTLTAPTLRVTGKSNVSVVFYRTLNNGTTFQRLNSVAVPVANSTTAATVSYTDNIADTALQSNETLYTDADALPNYAPPSCRAICNHQERIVIAGLEDPYEVQFSQVPIFGEGLYFNPSLSLRIPEEAGEITALSSLEDKLIIFTATKKVVVFGQGPDVTGANSTYSDPKVLPADTGCVDQRTIADTPDGLAYQSKHGLYLTGRDLQDHYFGYDVEGTVLGAVLTSAVVLQDKSQIRWTIPASSKLVVYDSVYKQWSTFTNYTAAAACNWNGYYTFASTNTPGLCQETVGTYRDLGTTAITVSGTTAWIRLDALQGFQRVWQALLIGPYYSASTLALQAAINYSSTLSATATIPVAASLVNAAGNIWQGRWKLPSGSQKCEAIKFFFQSIPSAGTYRGVGFSGLTLRLGVKKGAAKLPAAQSF